MAIAQVCWYHSQHPRRQQHLRKQEEEPPGRTKLLLEPPAQLPGPDRPTPAT